MLLRLTGHYPLNSQHIDKLIVINGLPDDWVFKARSDGQRELAAPFTPDIDANIPIQVRHCCTPEDIVVYYPPIEKGQQGITDKRRILGVRLDYMTEAGRSMWERIRRYVESMVPRDQQIPDPVVVAKDQRSSFETFALRKRITGGVEMEPSEVPTINLPVFVPTPISPPVSPVRPSPPEEAVALPPQPADTFACIACQKVFNKRQALRMHTMKMHSSKVKQKAGAVP